MKHRIESAISKPTLNESSKTKFFFFFKEDSLRDLWYNMKHNNIHITGLQEGKESKGSKTYLKK